MLGRSGGVLLACLTLAGCATAPAPQPGPPPVGEADWRAVDSGATAHYPLAIGETASGATISARVTPDYPASVLAACPPPVEVVAQLIVSTDGAVAEVRVADEAGADAQRRSFIGAVRAAAMQWRFTPLQVNHWAADAHDESHPVDNEVLPFSRYYRFRFTCHAGMAQVSTDDAAPAR